MDKIYVKFKKPRTVKKFLALLFSYYNYDRFKSIATYKDLGCKEIQCDVNKYRSIDDLYNIVKTYYPSITKNKLLHHLLCLRIKYNYGCYRYFYPVFCSDINKYTCMFYIKINKFNNIKNIYYKYNNKSLSSISWLELYNKLGINSQKDLNKYLKDNKIITINHEKV